MELPSKELLTKVLGVRPIVEMEYEFDSDYNTYFIRTNSGKERNYPYFLIDPTITIVSDLAHKCKEWLEKLCSNYEVMVVGSDVFLMNNIWGESGAYIYKTFDKEAEWYFNMFKACQWLLEERNIRSETP